jgi:hypothetical protein
MVTLILAMMLAHPIGAEASFMEGGATFPLCQEQGQVYVCNDPQRTPFCYEDRIRRFLPCDQVRERDTDRGMRIARAFMGGGLDAFSTFTLMEVDPNAYELNTNLVDPTTCTIRESGNKRCRASTGKVLAGQMIYASLMIGLGEWLSATGHHKFNKAFSRIMLAIKAIVAARHFYLAATYDEEPGQAPAAVAFTLRKTW